MCGLPTVTPFLDVARSEFRDIVARHGMEEVIVDDERMWAGIVWANDYRVLSAYAEYLDGYCDVRFGRREALIRLKDGYVLDWGNISGLQQLLATHGELVPSWPNQDMTDERRCEIVRILADGVRMHEPTVLGSPPSERWE
jgi:hypothetical protein